MAKHIQFQPTQFALIAHNQTRRKINGTGSQDDLDATRIFAQNLLSILPEATYIDIHPYDHKAWTYVQTPIETIHRDKPVSDEAESSGEEPSREIPPSPETETSEETDTPEAAAPTGEEPIPMRRRRGRKSTQTDETERETIDL